MSPQPCTVKTAPMRGPGSLFLTQILTGWRVLVSTLPEALVGHRIVLSSVLGTARRRAAVPSHACGGCARRASCDEDVGLNCRRVRVLVCYDFSTHTFTHSGFYYSNSSQDRRLTPAHIFRWDGQRIRLSHLSLTSERLETNANVVRRKSHDVTPNVLALLEQKTSPAT